MNVGRRVDYAVRALSYLAGQPEGKIVSRAEIERSQDIPTFYLSKIMKDLVAGGLVRSHIGSKGASRWPRTRARFRSRMCMRRWSGRWC